METGNKTQKELKSKLQEKLDETRILLEKGFSQEKLDGLKTEGIRREMSRFAASSVKDVVNDLQIASNIIKSPTYVGMLGRYSHGKTALVNSLFDLDEEFTLPEGEGVVTSKVTRVDFSNESTSEARKVKKDGSEEYIDIATLRNIVGNTKIDTSSVDYYYLHIPTSGKDFANLFNKKNISLIDMPGLGGPYFKDQTTTRRYIDNLDMLIAVVKIDGIREAGPHIEPYIQSATVPVIPVLTFGDLWQNSDLYAGCEDFDAMLFKAKQMINEYIPSLGKYIDNLIAVSAKTGHNIDNLRSLILSKIEVGQMAITKVKIEISDVYRRQVAALKSEFSTLKPKLNDLVDNLGKLMKPILPTGDKINDIGTVFESSKVKRAYTSFLNEANYVIDDAANEFASHCAGLRNKQSKKDLTDAVTNLEKDANNQILANKVHELNTLYERFKDEVVEAMDKYIEQKAYDNIKKKELKEKVADAIRNFDKGLKWQQVLGIKFDTVKLTAEYGKHEVKSFGNILIEMFKDPTTIVMFIGGVILVPIKWKVLKLIGIGLIVASIIQVLLRIPGRQKAQFQELRDNIVDLANSFFDKASMKATTKEKVEALKQDMIDRIKEELEEDSSGYKADASVLRILQKDIETNIDELSDLIEDNLAIL